MRKLLSCLGKYKKYAILTPVMVVFEVAFEVFIPYIMKILVDEGIDKGNLQVVVESGVAMCVLAILALVFGVFAGKFAVKASTGLAAGIRQREFDKIQEFSFANIDKYSTASLLTRLTTDITYTQQAFQVCIRMLVRAPFMLISASMMAVLLNAQLSIVFAIAVPVLGIALFLIIRTAYPRFNYMLTRYDKMNASVQENLIAIRAVKAFVRKDYENEKFCNASDMVMKTEKQAEKILLLNSPIMQFVMYTCTILVSWFGGKLVIQNVMGTGDLMSFMTYISNILMSLMMISMAGVMVAISSASVKRINEILDEPIDITNSDTDEDLQDGSIVFQDVSFSYTKDMNKLVLSDINLEIKSGETIGIIGGTGSSKTSFVQLIARLYDATSGEVIVGRHNVKDYKIEHLRNEVAMVLQKNVLFSGTITENLKWGNAAATDEEIVDACKAAQAHDFIMSFPKQYETDLGQGGVNVSGGQKQRLCIARALLKKPRIIILDDSTSAVDTATDSKIRTALKTKLANTTAIIIAQRVASVCDADRIIVLHEGTINAIGTHESLLASNEIYQEVYYSQQKGALE